jgi:hypothetical protein
MESDNQQEMRMPNFAIARQYLIEHDIHLEDYIDDFDIYDFKCDIDMHEPCPINQIIHHMDHLLRDIDEHFSRVVVNEITDSVIHHGNDMHPAYGHTRNEIYELYTMLRQHYSDVFHMGRFRGFDERGFVL